MLGSTFVSALALASVASAASLQARQYQDPDSQLLVDYPSCSFYKCIVDWTAGEKTYINWSNAPTGDVQLDLMMNDNNDVAFPIANTTSPSASSTCDAGQGVGVEVAGKPCGRFSFIVPSEWVSDKNYSVRAFLKSDTSIESYTDVVHIHAAADNANIPFSALSPTDGTATASSSAPSSTTNGTASTAAPTAQATGSNTTKSGTAASATSSSGSNGAPAQLQGIGITAILTLAASVVGLGLLGA